MPMMALVAGIAQPLEKEPDMPTPNHFARLAAIALAVAAISTASARAAPGDDDAGPSDPCLKQVYDLAETAEAKQLPVATMEKLDGMFNTMEQHCKAKEQPQASAVAADIKKVIDEGK